MRRSLTMVLALIAIWYVAAVAMNWSLVRDGFEREETPYAISDVLAGTMDAERPLLPAPHQVDRCFLDCVFGYPPLAPRSLVYHSLVTLSATLLGFLLGALFGIVLALLIVHSRVLERSLLPWIICSQMVPMLALAPIFVVVLGASDCTDFCRNRSSRPICASFPIAIGMVKGFTSPDPLQLELMRTWSATPRQVLWKLRWPASVPYLFASLKVADHHFADRRHRRRIADRRRSRHRRAAACRLLLRADSAALGGAGRRRRSLVRLDRADRTDRARNWPAHGGALMDRRKLRLGFIAAAAALALAFLLPLAPQSPPLSAYPIVWPDRRCSRHLVPAGRLAAGQRSTLPGLAGATLAAAASLVLLDDAAVAGAARAGFWMIVMACWLRQHSAWSISPGHIRSGASCNAR